MTSGGWTLDSAMASWACPICVLTRQDVFNFLAKQLFAWSTDEAVGLELVAQGGFCAQHVSHVLDMASALAVASIYGRFFSATLDVLEDWRKRIELDAASPPNSPLLHPDCPVCVCRRESETRHVAELLVQLDDEAHRKQYEQSRGLCLPHLRLALHQAERKDMRIFLLKAQVAQIQRLQLDLASSKRKRRALPQEQMTPHERTAWMSVVEKFAGKPC